MTRSYTHSENSAELLPELKRPRGVRGSVIQLVRNFARRRTTTRFDMHTSIDRSHEWSKGATEVTARSIRSRSKSTRLITAASAFLAAALVAAAAMTALAPAATKHTRKHHAHATQTGAAAGLGQLSGLLPRSHLTEESAIQINLSNEAARLPIYPGTAPDPKHPGQAEKVWYLLLDASDQGLAHDLGVNYAPKLANIAVGDPAAGRR